MKPSSSSQSPSHYLRDFQQSVIIVLSTAKDYACIYLKINCIFLYNIFITLNYNRWAFLSLSFTSLDFASNKIKMLPKGLILDHTLPYILPHITTLFTNSCSSCSIICKGEGSDKYTTSFTTVAPPH
ncbi:hypothetical protein SK128_023219 [Halocaridina rubra]|uniref:Uncharacterized protein n=1 Tax=Halocaridina rubra TaxID=373956 RepID=A0AAN8WIS8_HALRR